MTEIKKDFMPVYQKEKAFELQLQQDLKTMVKDTFAGSPAAVQQKQKANAKSLQYEGYKGRRQ